MAVAFCVGVSQVIPSTPGVRLPRFSVTRRTASALPLNEWVSKRWSALTLPHLPACVAFTIRAWSRRTLRCTAYQSMVCQFIATWEAAPAVGWAVICFASAIGCTSALVRRDLVEVCPLSRAVMLQPLSAPLQRGLGFLHAPLPATSLVPLARPYPVG